MNVITVYSLFFDDIRVVVFPAWADYIFYAITFFAMIAFAGELCFASVVKEDYFLSFFFWLDMISTISMVPDIGWIWNPLT